MTENSPLQVIAESFDTQKPVRITVESDGMKYIVEPAALHRKMRLLEDMGKQKPISIEAGAIAASKWRNGKITTAHWDEFSVAERMAYRDQVKQVAIAWGLSYVD